MRAIRSAPPCQTSAATARRCKLKIALPKIITDAGTQCRAELNHETVSEYAEAMKSGVKFPPPVVFTDGKGYWLADGFHRLEAAEQNGEKFIECDLRQGKRLDAVKFSLGANAAHGLRRTNADKQKSADIAVREFPDSSDGALAEMCAVSRQLIVDARQRQVANFATSKSEKPSKSQVSAPPPRRTGKDGKTYSVPPRNSSPPPRKLAAPPAVLDSTGIEVPPEILDLWNSAFQRSQRLLNFASEIRTEIRHAQDANELMFREIDHTDNLAKLDQVFADLKRAKPYAVCPDCNGVAAKGCSLCKERGFVSEFAWKNFVPAEKKKITGREDKEVD